RDAVFRRRLAVRDAPTEPHERDRQDDNAESEMQADEGGHRRVAADMRHGPGENELSDQQYHDQPVQRFCGARVASLRHRLPRPLIWNQTAPIWAATVMSSRKAPSSSGHELMQVTPDVRAPSHFVVVSFLTGIQPASSAAISRSRPCACSFTTTLTVPRG